MRYIIKNPLDWGRQSKRKFKLNIEKKCEPYAHIISALSKTQFPCIVLNDQSKVGNHCFVLVPQVQLFCLSLIPYHLNTYISTPVTWCQIMCKGWGQQKKMKFVHKRFMHNHQKVKGPQLRSLCVAICQKIIYQWFRSPNS